MSWRNDLRKRLSNLIAELARGLVERDAPVRLALLAALSGEHLLLLGPAGTAKSEIARRLRSAFGDAPFFERLLTRFSVPEELFGPLSLKALENDEYRRLTDGYLPSASVAFLDEIFKANSAILNALLGILSEREFDNGSQRSKVPLIAVIAASNELPDGEELHALHDRFLLRFCLSPVSAAGFRALLQVGASGAVPPPELRLTLEDLERVRTDAQAVATSDGVLSALEALHQYLAENKIYVSDRRWVKIIKLLQVAAFTEGRDIVLLSDCWVLQHCVWERPEQLGVIQEWFELHLRELIQQEPERYQRLLDSVAKFVKEQRQFRHKKDRLGRPLYFDESGQPSTEAKGRRPISGPDGEILFYPPGHHSGPGYTSEQLFRFFGGDLDAFDRYISNEAHQVSHEVDREPVLEPVRQRGEHLEQRLVQLDEVVSDLERFMRAVTQQAQEGGSSVPLWLPSEAANKLSAQMTHLCIQLPETLATLRQIRADLAALPRKP